MTLLPLPLPSSCVYIFAQTTCRGPSLTCSEGISIGGCAYVTRPRGYSLTPFTFYLLCYCYRYSCLRWPMFWMVIVVAILTFRLQLQLLDEDFIFLELTRRGARISVLHLFCVHTHDPWGCLSLLQQLASAD